MNPDGIYVDGSGTDASQNETASAAHNHRLMTEFSIVAAGRYFYYEGYRYDHLDDAVAYAQVIRTKGSQRTNPSPWVSMETTPLLNEFDKQVMDELSIGFVEGRFVFRGDRYDRLIDATNYARHLRDTTPNAS